MASPNKVNLSRMVYVVYGHPDLAAFEKFAEDFGFAFAERSADGHLYLRGYGIDQYIYIAFQTALGKPKEFLGAGFMARTSEDFERACKMDGAQLVDISGRPGGGKMVRIPDPNGFAVEVVFGQQERSVPKQGISHVVDGQPNVNLAMEKPRKGVFNRFNPGPAMIHKLGHFGYSTDNHAATSAWYSGNFNFKATDIVHKPGDRSAEILSFYHLDLGEEYSDHHCLLLSIHWGPGKSGTSVHHSSFEVEDVDTQMMGHKYLTDKGYRQMWGVGRHVIGSQIFDYWYDPTGFAIEHYSDSDVVNQDTPTCYQSDTPGSIWGPSTPATWD
ncbi:Uncharacterized protein TCAP_03795 [Tolypocladium capitatum]|uniref:VOC domain-containing protein n=1 Tax=Tolypocladium capitatum TaxID=45235 RepID=A0A2K3QFI5_9HYPO|nr:Uncharacterized protein TCAP_03795 [Tolypocladium capitatum]